MTLARPFAPELVRARRRRRLVTWVVVACVVAVVIEIGAVTNVFGLGSLFQSSGPSSSPPANPNPFDENITSVVGAIAYSGSGADPFPILNGGELCDNCPFLPKENANVSPVVAEVWVYFNVTYTGSNTTTISNFTLTTSGADPELFVLLGVFVPPLYDETVGSLSFWETGQTWAMAFHAEAISIPNDGSTGYQLTFHVTSP